MIKRPPKISYPDNRGWGDKSVEEKYAGFGSRKFNAPMYQKKKYNKKIIVDLEGYGDCRFLSEAIRMAEEGTVIKLCEGVHFCKSTITKGGIKIEPYYKDKPAYLLGDEGPTIKIKVDMDDINDHDEASRKCVILKRLVLTHNGEAIVKNFKEL